MNWYNVILLRRTARTFLLFFCVLAAFSPMAAAADFPAKPLSLSIVFSPGGGLDSAARVLAKEAEAALGQRVVPFNHPGGGGMSGLAQLAKAAPDGYTLAACVSNALIFLPHRNTAPYRPLSDFEPIITFGQASPVLVVAPDSPWNDLEAFLEATRAKKGEMRVGVPGLGTPSHIALAMMSQTNPSLSWRFVPFGGPGEAEAALLGGHVDAAASGALPRIRDGQLKALLVLAGSSPPGLEQIPCLTDKRFADAGQGDSTFVLLAPKGTPEAVLDRLEAVFLQAAGSEAYRKVLEAYSISPALRGRAEAKAFLREAWETETATLHVLGMGDKPATRPE